MTAPDVTVRNSLPSPATLLTPRAARVLLRIITKAVAKQTTAESEAAA
ncbi:MAG TPA: hypothetical protein VHU85_17815 [Acidimicrobiales bacterium]|nr:hypothetical protein [Acidimicrobiales bacterium]